MAWVAVLVPLTLLWNLIMLSGLLGGRASKPWRRRLWTTVQILLFAVGFFIMLAFVVLVAKARTKGEAALVFTEVGGPAVIVGTLLTYLEYLIARRSGDFRAGLRTFLWFGH